MKINNLEKDMLNVAKYLQDNIIKTHNETKNLKDKVLNSTSQLSEFNKDIDDKLKKQKESLKSLGIDLISVEKEIEVSKKDVLRGKDKNNITKYDEKIEHRSFEDIVKIAEENGYINTTIEDLLTLEELEDVEKRFEEINAKFIDKTKFDYVDLSFIVVATMLQCVRQYVFTSFEERYSHNEGDKKTADQKKKWKEKFPEDIQNIIVDGVPYDVIRGSKELNLGLSGNNHRVKTLGHDPLLGWLFGTMNILTSTLTDCSFSSYKVQTSPVKKIVDTPSITTLEMLEAGFEKGMENKVLMAAAVIKQGLHLKSDIGTKAGLPIPLVSIVSPEVAQKLSEIGIDFQTVLTVGKQATYSIAINYLIALIHALYYDETKYSSRELYEVKTRKILLYSNLLASSSNIIVVAFQKDRKKIDIGGLLVTMWRLFSDVRFITKVKDDFINMEIDKDIEYEIERLNQLLLDSNLE